MPDHRPELAEIACPNCHIRNDCRECDLYEFSLLAAIIRADGDESQIDKQKGGAG